MVTLAKTVCALFAKIFLEHSLPVLDGAENMRFGNLNRGFIDHDVSGQTRKEQVTLRTA